MPDNPRTDGAVDDPPYRVYRSRPKLLARGELGPDRPASGRGGDRSPKPIRTGRRRPSGWRIARWVLSAVVGWIALSAVAFLVSAVLAGEQVDDSTLDPGGPGLASPTTVLLLGSDARSKATSEPGSQGQPSRADSILLLRTGGGASAKLSIPRDTLAEIPGRGREKINAAFAYGGAALQAATVKQLLGIEVNHVMLIDFERFPGLIDAMGGIDYTGSCVVSRINGGSRNGGVTLRLPAGTNHIDGRQALALARTRKNACNPREDDRARARRQQKIVGAMRDRAIGPIGFLRMPLIAWATPRALRTDMGGPSLMAFAVGAALSGDGATRVLPVNTDPGGGSGLVVDEAAKARAVERFLAG